MYRSLFDVANDVAELLKATEAFRAVDVAAVSNGEQLFKAASNLAVTPSAVVCIGEGDFQQMGSLRNFSVIIAIFAKFAATKADKAANIWSLLETAAEPFLPVFAAGQPPTMPVINGIQYEAKGWSPIGGNASTPAFSIELDAVEIFKIETEES